MCGVWTLLSEIKVMYVCMYVYCNQQISHMLVAWLSGNALISINVVTSLSTSGPVSTWMGDRVRAGKPSRYVTSQLGRLSLLPSVE